MVPDRIIFIRHAEHHAEPGFTEDGRAGEHSLTIRGWQRAGALIGLFGPRSASDMMPDALYTSAVGDGSPSHRPQQTVAPLHAALEAENGVRFDCTFLKPDVEGLMGSVLGRSGTVLICWEHSCIPEAIGVLPHAPTVPAKWPSDRYDLIWILDRDGVGWTFRQGVQRLLPGDAGAP